MLVFVRVSRYEKTSILKTIRETEREREREREEQDGDFSETQHGAVAHAFVIIAEESGTSCFLDQRDSTVGSYFKFAGDLQESSSRGKS